MLKICDIKLSDAVPICNVQRNIHSFVALWNKDYFLFFSFFLREKEQRLLSNETYLLEIEEVQFPRYLDMKIEILNMKQ